MTAVHGTIIRSIYVFVDSNPVAYTYTYTYIYSKNKRTYLHRLLHDQINNMHKVK